MNTYPYPAPQPQDSIRGNAPESAGSLPQEICGESVAETRRISSKPTRVLKKIYFLLLSLLFLVLPFPAGAFSPLLDGTMRTYDFRAGDTVVPWGDDMTPVMINYVARHGARFLSSEKKIAAIRDYLLKAGEEGRLTEKGKDFLNLISRVEQATSGRWGALNDVGIAEQQRLAREMTVICSTLLKEGNVEAVSTYVPRVVLSMYEFCHALVQYSSRLEVIASEGREYSPLLRYFETDKEYKEYIEQGPWRSAYDHFKRVNTPVEPVVRMVKGVVDEDELQGLTLDAYGVLQSLSAAGIACDASQWFSEDEYRRCWEVTNLKHYYQRSASTFSPLPAQSADPLLENIKESIEKGFSGECGEKAILRFGHAETLIPLFALMKLPGCYAPDCMPDEVASRWNDSEISPLGANLMIVSLKDKVGGEYIALRLNGRWLPLQKATEFLHK